MKSRFEDYRTGVLKMRLVKLNTNSAMHIGEGFQRSMENSTSTTRWFKDGCGMHSSTLEKGANFPGQCQGGLKIPEFCSLF